MEYKKEDKTEDKIKQESRMSAAGRVAFCGMLCALALIFSYVEALIPIHFAVPGIKLGLANLVVLSGLYLMRPREVLTVSIARILIASFLFGNGMSLAYSLAGGILSFAVMVLLKRSRLFSYVGVSIAGAVAHNIGQILVAAAVVRTVHLLYYVPALLIAGVVTGTLMGILNGLVLPPLRRLYER